MSVDFSHLFLVSLFPGSWVDVAAVCTPHHQCHSVCGGVCQTHCWLHGPVPEWSDYIAESRSVHRSQIRCKVNKVWNVQTSVPSCLFVCLFYFSAPSLGIFLLSCWLLNGSEMSFHLLCTNLSLLYPCLCLYLWLPFRLSRGPADPDVPSFQRQQQHHFLQWKVCPGSILHSTRWGSDIIDVWALKD